MGAERREELLDTIDPDQLRERLAAFRVSDVHVKTLAGLRSSMETILYRELRLLRSELPSYPTIRAQTETLTDGNLRVIMERLLLLFFGEAGTREYFELTVMVLQQLHRSGFGMDVWVGFVARFIDGVVRLIMREHPGQALELLETLILLNCYDASVASDLYVTLALDRIPPGKPPSDAKLRDLLIQDDINAPNRSVRARYYRFGYPEQLEVSDVASQLMSKVMEVASGIATLIETSFIQKGKHVSGPIARFQDELGVHWSLTFTHPEQGVQVERATRLGVLYAQLGLNPTWFLLGWKRIFIGLLETLLQSPGTTPAAVSSVLRLCLLDSSYGLDSFNRSYLREIITATEGPYFELDTEGTLVAWNGPFLRAFPGNYMQVRRRRVAQVLPELAEAAEQVIQEGNLYQGESAFSTALGRFVYKVRLEMVEHSTGGQRRLHGQLWDDRESATPLPVLVDTEPEAKLLIETIGAVVWSGSREGPEIARVSGLRTVLGQSAAWVMAKPDGWLSLIHPEDQPAFSEALRSSRASSMHVRMRHLSGSWIWTYHWIRKSQDGELTGVFVDESERMQERAELEESTHRYRQLFQTLPVSVWEVDMSELRLALQKDDRLGTELRREEMHALLNRIRIRDVNQVTLDLLEVESRMELVERRGSIAQDSWYTVIGEAVTAFGRGESTYRGEALWRNWDTGKSLRFVADITLVTGYEGDWRRVLLTFQNVSEIHEKERDLRLIRTSIQMSPQPIYWLNNRARIVYANEAARKLYGATDENIYRLHFWDIDPTRDRDAWPSRLEELRRLRSQIYESVHRSTDGSEFPVEVRSSMVEFEDEEYLFCAITDLTARKQAELRQAELREQLRLASQMEAVGHLTGGIAHDFNNIVHGILGHAEYALGRVEEPSDVANSLAEIQRAALRAGDLIRQILSTGRRKGERFGPVDTGELVREAARLIRASIDSRIDVRVEVADDLPKAFADGTRIHQVVLNLCTNAAQAIRGSGQITITVSTLRLNREDAARKRLTPGQYLKIEVADDGCGMPENVASRVFEPFFTTRVEQGGTGLGLSTSAEIIRRHRGAMSVSSKVGVGTLFEILLPEASASLPKAQISTDLPLPTGSERILWVDDEASIVRFGERALKRLGYEVRPLTSPKEALEVIRDDPRGYDLLITDLTMPDLNGLELAKEVHRLRPGLPIILCTGYAEIQSSEEMARFGICEHLVKPWPLRELARAIRSALKPIAQSTMADVIDEA